MDITIYIKDSTDNMDDIQTASVDLIITSPPYWNLVDYGHSEQLGMNISYKHFIFQIKKNLLNCMRVLKEDALACFVVGDIRTGKYTNDSRPCIYSLHSDLINFFTVEMDFFLFQHFIWEKFGVKKGKKSGIIYGSVCKGEFKDFAVPPYLYSDLLIEHILVFRKPGKRRLPALKERQKDRLNLISKTELKEWLNPIWHVNSHYNSEHGATFPEALVERLIRMYSLKGDKILDPFCGTGTTLRKAIQWKRNAVGYEINEKYVRTLIEEFCLQKSESSYFAIINEGSK